MSLYHAVGDPWQKTKHPLTFQTPPHWNVFILYAFNPHLNPTLGCIDCLDLQPQTLQDYKHLFKNLSSSKNYEDERQILWLVNCPAKYH